MESDFREFLSRNRVIPVAVFDSVECAVAVTEILLKNSIRIVEVTLRTTAALDAIEAISEKFPEMAVGAGSVLTAESFSEAFGRGITFGVSPVFDPELAECAKSLNIPYIPGIATPSELHIALKYSRLVKIFPVDDLGGLKFIKSLAAPFAMKEFNLIPTGGVNKTNYLEYLGADRVIACGMTWMIDSELLKKKDYRAVESRVKSIVSGLGVK